MVRKKAASIWGQSQGKAEMAPVARNRVYEAQLCQAIAQKVRVQLKYADDLAYRTYEPYCVFTSTRGKVCVSGTQVINPEKPSDAWEPHNFEVGRIASLLLTGTNFKPDARFDPMDAKYQNGIICKIQPF